MPLGMQFLQTSALTCTRHVQHEPTRVLEPHGFSQPSMGTTFHGTTFHGTTCPGTCRGYSSRSVKPENLALLNAKPENVRREAQIIAQAGLPGAVTIATNMAGRGTDIVLGGNPKGLALQALMKLFARYFLTGGCLTACMSLVGPYTYLVASIHAQCKAWCRHACPPAMRYTAS